MVLFLLYFPIREAERGLKPKVNKPKHLPQGRFFLWFKIAKKREGCTFLKEWMPRSVIKTEKGTKRALPKACEQITDAMTKKVYPSV